MDEDVLAAISAWENNLAADKKVGILPPQDVESEEITRNIEMWESSLTRRKGPSELAPKVIQPTPVALDLDRRGKRRKTSFMTKVTHKLPQMRLPSISSTNSSRASSSSDTSSNSTGVTPMMEAASMKSKHQETLRRERQQNQKKKKNGMNGMAIQFKKPQPLPPMGTEGIPCSTSIPEPPQTAVVIKGMSILLSYMVVQTEPQSAADQPSQSRVIREDLNEFISNLYNICKWSDECNLLGFVYLLRLQAKSISSLTLRKENCKILLVGALVIAQKYWDDNPLRNQDIPIAWYHSTKDKRINLRQVNNLELEMLKAMAWELYVSEQDYAACYKELVSLVSQEGS